MSRQKSQKRLPRGEAGFSLIEVMVSIVILTVGLLSLAQMMVVATNANSLAGRMTASAAMAKERLELLRAAPFYTDVNARTVNPILQPGGDVNNNAGGYFQYYDIDGRPLPGAGGALYLVRWQVQNLGVGALPLAMIRITVRCLPAAETGAAFQVIGDATYITFRSANVGG